MQALRELDGRVRHLREAKLELRRLEWSIKKRAAARKSKQSNEFEHELDKIEIEKLELDFEYAARGAREAEREAWRFFQQASYLKKRLPVLTPENREKLERDFWLQQIRRRCAIDLLSPPFHDLSAKTRESLFALPPDLRMRVLLELNDKDLRRHLLAWYQGLEPDLEQEIPVPKDGLMMKALEAC